IKLGEGDLLPNRMESTGDDVRKVLRVLSEGFAISSTRQEERNTVSNVSRLRVASDRVVTDALGGIRRGEEPEILRPAVAKGGIPHAIEQAFVPLRINHNEGFAAGDRLLDQKFEKPRLAGSR